MRKRTSFSTDKDKRDRIGKVQRKSKDEPLRFLNLELQGRTTVQWRVAGTFSASRREESSRDSPDSPDCRWAIIRRVWSQRRRRRPTAPAVASTANPCRRHWVRIATRDIHHVPRRLLTLHTRTHAKRRLQILVSWS